MPEPLGDLHPYLIQVLNPLGEVEGTSFVCHPDGYALTCWHVVESWHETSGEKGKVVYRRDRIDAELIVERSDRAADLAVLRLIRPDAHQASSPWPYLPLEVDWERVQISDQLQSFGYPKGQFSEEGISIAAKIQSLTLTHVGGVEVFPLAGFNMDNIDGGYSGAPIVDESTQKVIGLIHAKHHQTQAFIVRLAPLFTLWPDLRALHDVFERIRRRLAEAAQAKLVDNLRAAPFIPLDLESGEVISKKSDGHDDAERGSNAWEHVHGRRWAAFDPRLLLPPRGAFVLSSDAGTGKTTFVHWLATELVRQTRFVPVVMSCQELERLNPKNLEDLLKVLSDPLKREFKSDFLQTDLEAFFARAAKKGELALLLDGLDQVPSGKPSNLVKLAFEIAGRCPVILTSRPSAVAVRTIENDPKLMFLRLRPFSAPDQQRYFGEHYWQAKAVCALAPDLTKLPMLAYMVRDLVEAGKIKTAVSRTELYVKFAHHVVTEHGSKRSQDEIGLTGKVERVLRQLSFDALAAAQPKIQRVPIEVYANDALVPLTSLIEFGLINRILDRGEEALFFSHQSFQEFLAAQYAAERSEAVDHILSERWHPKWAAVIHFLAGLKGEAILQRVLGDPDNVIHFNLFLAASCASEVKAPSAQLVDPIKAELLELAAIEPFCIPAIWALAILGRWLGYDDMKRIIEGVHDVGEDESIRSTVVAAFESLGDRLGAEAIHAIMDGLHNEESSVRRTAVEALGSLSDRLDARALRAIVGRLSDDDSSVRRTAIKALRWLANRLDAEAVRAVVPRLSDEDFRVRRDAVRALGLLGDRLDAEGVRAILDRLSDADLWVRRGAIRTLASLGGRLDAEGMRAIAGRLGDKDEHVRESAVEALRSLGDRLDPDALHALVGWVYDEDPSVRVSAIRALRSLGDRLDVETLRAIVARVHDEPYWMRSDSVEALGSLGDWIDAEAVRAIVGRLSDEHRWVRSAAIKGLQSLGRRLDAEAVRAIVDRLNDEDSLVRWSAFEALGSLGDRLDAEAVRAIMGRLSDEDKDMRWSAVRTLALLGDRLGVEAVHAIIGRMGDEDSAVRGAAVDALGSLGARLDAEAVHTIVGRLGDEDEWVRLAAVKALASLSDRLDTEAVRAIADRLCDKDWLVRQEAIRALGPVGDRLDAEAVRVIVGWLRDETPDVRRAAVDALGPLGDRLDAEAVRTIVHCLRDYASEVRQSAVRTLGSLGDRLDAETVRAIVGWLREEDALVRFSAVEALGWLGNRLDAAAVSAVAGLLSDEAKSVRRSAAILLGSLGDRLDTEAVRAIIGRLSDENLEMRRIAYRILLQRYTSGWPLAGNSSTRAHSSR
jgi:HEAT repeat protein